MKAHSDRPKPGDVPQPPIGKRLLFITAFGIATVAFSLALRAQAAPIREADVISAPPFAGQYSETWEEFPIKKFGSSQIPILDGTGTVFGTQLETDTTHMFLLCHYYAGPTDGNRFMGADSPSASMTISFSQPVSAFGGYWGNFPSIQGCAGGDTRFRFLDSAGKVVGEVYYPPDYPPGPGGMIWRGFALTKPITTVEVAGTYVVTDGMQATVNLGNSLPNISTRSAVQTNENVLIGGFIVTGNAPKTVLIRGMGPSLGGAGLGQPLADPTLELHSATALLASNDNWKDTQRDAIQNTGIPPGSDLESAIVAQLDPGAYTAILAGKNAGTGVGLVEVYDLNPTPDSRLANISTRSVVGTGTDVMIGGFILTNTTRVLVRALGPSLTKAGVSNPLANPCLELHAQDGTMIASDDDWKETQQSAIEAIGIPPTNDKESAILQALPPGNYTAVVRGVDNAVGTALVEVYGL